MVYIPKEKNVDEYVQRLYDCNDGLKEYGRLYVAYGCSVYLVK